MIGGYIDKTFYLINNLKDEVQKVFPETIFFSEQGVFFLSHNFSCVTLTKFISNHPVFLSSIPMYFIDYVLNILLIT